MRQCCSRVLLHIAEGMDLICWNGILETFPFCTPKSHLGGGEARFRKREWDWRLIGPRDFHPSPVLRELVIQFSFGLVFRPRISDLHAANVRGFLPTPHVHAQTERRRG